MKAVHMTIDPAVPATLLMGRMDPVRVDATSEQVIAAQQATDAHEAIQDAAKFARRVHKRLGLSQMEFSECIDVPIERIRKRGAGQAKPYRRCQGPA